jgi:hypothetical protein
LIGSSLDGYAVARQFRTVEGFVRWFTTSPRFSKSRLDPAIFVFSRTFLLKAGFNKLRPEHGPSAE